MMRGEAHRGCGEKTGFGILVESGCPVAGGGLFAEDGIGILQGLVPSAHELHIIRSINDSCTEG